MSPNHIDSVMSGVPAVSVVEYKSQSAQIKDYKISVFCFSTKCIAFRSKNKDWLESGLEFGNFVITFMSEWSNLSTRG